MGYSYYIPTLPCYHSVLNKSHLISGEIQYPDNNYLLDNALGYMEKNWGTSFPDNYFWMHAVDPTNPSISLLFSQAEIKWLGKSLYPPDELHVVVFHDIVYHLGIDVVWE